MLYNAEAVDRWLRWLMDIHLIAQSEGHGEYASQLSPDCWRESFDEGLSPQDAWAEEMDAASAH